ncbi:hypothetical protein [Paenibacillus contaminans]|uniref:Uncharacterized protein n=1 Tax=Paenibacillus contaminans TaxID=450362 RepID=A0A329MS78_9BACL|nr:hypothetical protein [Paenibacillus contaminans]RAV22644.1 hypothetical protein DQG23_00035 [Paenibacillus contaminans]
MENVYIYNRFIGNHIEGFEERAFFLGQEVSNIKEHLPLFGFKAVRAFSDLGYYDNELFNQMFEIIPYGFTIAMSQLLQVGDPTCLEKLSQKDIKILVIDLTLNNWPMVYSSKEIYESYMNTAV